MLTTFLIMHFQNVRRYKKVIRAYPYFHPLNHPIDAWKELQSNAPVNSRTPQKQVTYR